MHAGRRLTAFEIPVDSLGNATKDSLARALRLVKDRAIREVKQLRAEATGPDKVERAKAAGPHKAGRRHAFFAMLHLNATLALDIFAPANDRRAPRGSRNIVRRGG